MKSIALGLLLCLVLSSRAAAHCDTLDGPVVKAAQRALDTANVKLVLPWVAQPDEAEIVAAFDKTLAVRKLSPEARDLADRWFFETLVRVHRASEGEPFTGLKPAGADIGPAIPAAEKAIDTASLEPVIKLLHDAIETGAHHRLDAAVHLKNAAPDDVEARRKFTHAYIVFVHYVQRLHEAASAGSPASHAPETPAPQPHAH